LNYVFLFSSLLIAASDQFPPEMSLLSFLFQDKSFSPSPRPPSSLFVLLDWEVVSLSSLFLERMAGSFKPPGFPLFRRKWGDRPVFLADPRPLPLVIHHPFPSFVSLIFFFCTQDSFFASYFFLDLFSRPPPLRFLPS